MKDYISVKHIQQIYTEEKMDINKKQYKMKAILITKQILIKKNI